MELLFNFTNSNTTKYTINIDSNINISITKHSHPKLGVISLDSNLSYELNMIPKLPIIYNDTIKEFVPNYSSIYFIFGWDNDYTITYNNHIIKLKNNKVYKVINN